MTLSSLASFLGLALALVSAASGCAAVAAPTDGGTDAPITDSLAAPDSMVPADATTPDATASRCDPTQPRVEPTSYDDVTYAWATTRRVPCLAEACLCESRSPAASALLTDVLRCDPIAGGYYWGQGSATLLVRGRRERRCVIEVFQELEGGGTISRCEVPLPMAPWSGLRTNGDTTMGGQSLLAGIESYCTTVGTCSLVVGSGAPCGEDVTTCTRIGLGASACGATR
ncbi:MAG: hypothetical protein JNK05_06525 [Myxococcales bacterium]|nr:hypothetical protein [Myxococcales bacterium]